MTWKGVVETLRYPVLYAVWLQAAVLALKPDADRCEQQPGLMLLAHNFAIGAVLLFATISEALPQPSPPLQVVPWLIEHVIGH